MSSATPPLYNSSKYSVRARPYLAPGRGVATGSFPIVQSALEAAGRNLEPNSLRFKYGFVKNRNSSAPSIARQFASGKAGAARARGCAANFPVFNRVNRNHILSSRFSNKFALLIIRKHDEITKSFNTSEVPTLYEFSNLGRSVIRDSARMRLLYDLAIYFKITARSEGEQNRAS